MVKRHGFTLIELIFAILIMSIIVFSIPTMTQINAKASEGSISQEAVFAGSAKLLQTLSFPWDENSSDIELILEGATVLSGVVDIPAGRVSLDYNATQCRPGLINRFCRIDENGNEVNVSTIENDHTSFLIRGLDDSNGTFNMTNLTTNAEGYKNPYRMITTVQYVSDGEDSAYNEIDYNTNNPFAGNSFVFSDANLSTPTNLRLITVRTERRLSDGTWEEVVVLRGYAANIGEIKPYKETY